MRRDTRADRRVCAAQARDPGRAHWAESRAGGLLACCRMAGWYHGQSCVFCGKPIPEVTWTEHRPALLAPDGVTVFWKDVKPETLPDLFSTHKPVCWDCHVVQSLIRERPDAITVRPEREHLWS